MKKIIISIFTAIALSGCNDFIDLKPVDFPTEETFYTDVKGLEGAIIAVSYTHLTLPTIRLV